MTHKVCSVDCSIELVKRERKTKERIIDKIKRNLLKTKSYYVKQAQASINRYVRIRDNGKCCISSGRPLNASGNLGGSFDAGHYRSIGSAPHLRFHLWNIHGQSKHDNQYKNGNVTEYRKGLIARIGIEKVEMLENDQTPRKYSIDDLKRISKIFAKKAKRISAQTKF